MTSAGAKTQTRIYGWAVISALMGAALFQFFGNATRGYVDTSSLFWWWISQWIDPQAETEHGWLILGISLWLYWRNEAASRTNRLSAVEREVCANDARGKTPALEAMVAVGSALILHALGFIAQQSRISIVAFLLFAWGVIAMADRRRAKAAAFPLAFMVFAIPLNILDSVGFWLRLGVIDATEWLAHLGGLGVVRSGTQLFAPDGSYQYDVAAACSGVRSLMALSALSLLIGYLNFQSTSRRALMLFVCFPLTYLGNVTRVALIVVAAEWGGQRWGERVHDAMGYGVFLLVLGGVWLTAGLVRRRWPEAASLHLADRPGKRRWRIRLSPSFGGTMAVIFIAAEMILLSQIATPLHQGASGVRLSGDGLNPAELPPFLGTEWIGRRAEVSMVERETLPADTGYSRRTYISIQNRAHTVFLSIVLSGRDRTSIHRPELCLVGQGWTIRDTTTHAFTWPHAPSHLIPATVLHTTLFEPVSDRKIQAIVAYWFVSADGVVATHWQRFFRDAWNRVRHGRVDRWAYVLMQADAADGEAAALARIQTVLWETLPVFQRVGS